MITAIMPGCAGGLFFYGQAVNLSLLIILFSHFFITTYLREVAHTKADIKETNNNVSLTENFKK